MKNGKSIILLIVALVLSAVVVLGAGTSLGVFGADTGSLPSLIPGLQPLRLPYADVVSYYGYIKPGLPPDAVINGKNMYFVYLWIPVAAPEIGIRMVSPIPADYKPEPTDFVSQSYKDNLSDTTSYFDTWISFDRGLLVINPEDILSKGPSTPWYTLGSNDDSSELLAQPSGNRYNSVLRMKSELSDPLRSLIRGLYRIAFTTYKTGEVKGSFLAQIGATVKLPGVKVAPTLKELVAAINAGQ